MGQPNHHSMSVDDHNSTYVIEKLDINLSNNTLTCQISLLISTTHINSQKLKALQW